MGVEVMARESSSATFCEGGLGDKLGRALGHGGALEYMCGSWAYPLRVPTFKMELSDIWPSMATKRKDYRNLMRSKLDPLTLMTLWRSSYNPRKEI